VSFPRYPAYKDSGVEWLGEVPSEWKVTPLKSIARVINGFPFDSQSFDSNEGFPLVRIRDLNQSSPDTRYKGEFVETASVSNDDVLVGMDGDFNVGRWLGETPALLNQRMCCVRAETSMITRYLEYVLPIPLDSINNLTYATTVKHLSSYDVLKIRLAIPVNQSHVAGIVDFLDHETTKIDVLIAEQQRLIELLQEKRQAVISHAVTKGLNQGAPMKDSGVEWLGEVPEHWEIVRLGHRGRLQNGLNIGGDAFGSGDPFVSYGDVYNNAVLPEIPSGLVRSSTEEQIKYSSEVGDVLFTRTSESVDDIGIASVCLHAIPRSTFAGFLIRLRPYDNILDPRYSRYLFRNQGVQTHFAGNMNLVTRASLSQGELKTLPICIPPLDEQRGIAAALDEKTELFRHLIADAESTIALLQERRFALISAAVTGQIDVRGLVPEVADA